MRQRLHPAPFSPSSERMELSGLISGIPGFAAIGRRHYRSARHPVSPHKHHGLMEISFLARGQQTMQVGRQRLLLRANQLLVIAPGEMHGSAGQPAEHCTLYWLNLDVRDHQRFLAAEGNEARTLIQRLGALRGAVLAAPPWLRDAFDLAIGLHAGQSPLQRVRLLHELTRIVLGLIGSAQGPVPGHISEPVRLAQGHIAAHLGSPLRLAELAKVAGLSPTRLIVLFKRDTALTPREYVLREKVAASKRMLQSPSHSITEIAFALGFSTSQYYATVFRRFTGISPRDYRRRLSGGCNRKVL